MRHVSTTKVQSSRNPRICDGCLTKLGIGSSLMKIVNSEGRELFTTCLCIPCDTFLQQNPDAVDCEWMRGDVGDARWWAEQDERADNWGEWHQKSQQAIADGDLALALECEVKAIESLDPKNQARSIGITVVSACAIAYQARDFAELRKIADKWIPVIPQGFADEVKQILLDASTATAETIQEVAA